MDELTRKLRDGKKMSKRLKNYPDPLEVVSKYGADCVRLFLVNSPVVRGDNLRFREEGVREILTSVILKWTNSLNFYLGQVELLAHAGETFVYDHAAPKSKNVMDRWILASCQTLIQHVDQEMAGEAVTSIRLSRADSLSLPPIHCHSTITGPRRRSHQLVHPLQQDAAEGRWWARRYSRGSQHAVRDLVHPLPYHGEFRVGTAFPLLHGVVFLHPVHIRDRLPKSPCDITSAQGREGRCPVDPFLILPKGPRRVLRPGHRATGSAP